MHTFQARGQEAAISVILRHGQPVPELGTLALLAIGLLEFLRFRRPRCWIHVRGESATAPSNKRAVIIRQIWSKLAKLVVAAVGVAITLASAAQAARVDVSGQVTVTLSGYLFNRTTQTFDTTATLTNSLMPIADPVALEVTSISTTAVALANASGTTADGKPYVLVPLQARPLMPGQTVRGTVLKFRNPNRIPFTFATRVVAEVSPVVTADSIVSAVDNTGQTIALAGVGTLVMPAGAVESAAIEILRAPIQQFDEALARKPGYVDLQLPRLKIKSSVALKEGVLLKVVRPVGSALVPPGFEIKALLLFQDEHGETIVSAIPAHLCNGGSFACVELLPSAFKPVPDDPVDPVVEIMLVSVARAAQDYGLWRVAGVRPANLPVPNGSNVSLEANVFLSKTYQGSPSEFVVSPLAVPRIGGGSPYLLLRGGAGRPHFAIDLTAQTGTPVTSAHKGRYYVTQQAEGNRCIDSPAACGLQATSNQATAVRSYVNSNGLGAACAALASPNSTMPGTLLAAGVTPELLRGFLLCLDDPPGCPRWKVAHGVESEIADENLSTVYKHLQSHAEVNGAEIPAGRPIATSGNSGNSCAPHLHFAVELDGNLIDPRPLVLGAMNKYLLPSDPGDQLPFDAPTLQARIVVDETEDPEPLAIDTMRLQGLFSVVNPNRQDGGAVVPLNGTLPSRLVVHPNGDAEVRYKSPPIPLAARLQDVVQRKRLASGQPYTVEDLLEDHDVRVQLSLMGVRMGRGVRHVLHEWRIGQGGTLNDTGVTACVDCPAGNDAQYGRDALAAAGTLTKVGAGNAAFDFTALDAVGNPTSPSTGANPHPCVRDNITGLIWEVKTDDRGLRAQYWNYSWYNSNPATNGGGVGYANWGVCLNSGRCDTEKYVADVNASQLCGYTDWRMPTRGELHSIVNYGTDSPAIDTTHFPNTPELGCFWSSSPAAYPDQAWYVCSHGGGVGNVWRGTKAKVRLVRGGQ